MAFARQRIRLPKRSFYRAVTSGLRGRLWDGPSTAELERSFADFAGVPAAVAVPSGRAGLRHIFEVLGLEPGSEVICSAFGYPVVPHLAKSLGYDVRFADCELETLGMDPEALARTITDRTRAVITTHLYGVPCRVDEIARIAESKGAALIEDCAHCFGASVEDRMAGSFGRFGYFSFETSKPINTLGGGMVTATRAEDGERLQEVARAGSKNDLRWLARRLSKTSFEATVTHPLVFNFAVYPALRLMSGKDKEDDRFASGYQRDEVTMKGRLGRYSNFQAQLALDQMDRAARLIERRNNNAERLMARLDGKVRFQQNGRPGVTSNYMLVTALFDDMPEVARRLLDAGIDTKHHYMRDCSRLLEDAGPFPQAARAERDVLHLPAYPELSDAQIDRIADGVAQVVDAMASPARQTSELTG